MTRGGQRRLRSAGAQMAARQDRAARRRDAGARPHERVRRAQAAAIVRRPAAAHRAGALPRHRSQGAAARRAVRRARQKPAARHADRGQAAAARIRRHHHPGHARPGRSAVDGRPHRGDVARPIEQVSSPTEIYDAPKTLFVNEFVGTTNVLPASSATPARRPASRLPGGIGIDVPSTPGFLNGSKVAVSIRPEQLHIVPAGGLAGTIKAVMPLGAHVVYDVELAPAFRSRSASRAKARSPCGRPASGCMSRPTSPDACNVFPAS